MNKSENIAYYSDIGEVTYVQNNRAKNLSIRINQQGEVKVTIPRYISRRRAEGFLISKKAWISRKLSEINQLTEDAPIINEGDVLSIRGKEIPVVVQLGEKGVEDAMWRILLKEGQNYLPDRISELAGTYNLIYSEVKVRKMKTRWGSCTSRNSINLNSWLMMLPDHLMDYVILHELVHTIHKDHSKKFWNTLDGIMEGSSKRLRKELRSQRIMLINAED